MLSFFLKIMDQKISNNYVCVQLLQTLNILFENIRNETSIYYLLSNNHVNSIIVHKFDFSDEEVIFSNTVCKNKNYMCYTPGDGILYLLLKDVVFSVEQAHYSLLLQ